MKINTSELTGRAVVAAQLGYEVDIPDELVEGV